MALRTDFRNAQFYGKRKYNMINNPDGTVSFQDVTDYRVVGSEFGGTEANQTNQAINDLQNNMQPKIIFKQFSKNFPEHVANHEDWQIITIENISGYTPKIINTYNEQQTYRKLGGASIFKISANAPYTANVFATDLETLSIQNITYVEIMYIKQ